jgi:hypothetical protein
MMCAISMGLGWFESPPTTAGSHLALHASQLHRCRFLLQDPPIDFVRLRVTLSLNLALFDVDTLAQAVMSAVRDGDAAALERYWTRSRTFGGITSQRLNDRQHA